MSITIQIPSALRAFTDRKPEIAVEGKTVREAIGALADAYPDIRPHLFDASGALRAFVNIYVAGKNIRHADGIETVLPDGEILALVPAIAGGAGQ
ncbi:MAG: MoaD/ThiS family protein [Zoogloeaceae bacterium]|jgi:molybdopterin converting factor small subunit|nr:MoaD/ThiS family protein [Zoogloeaceae bacterium]